MSWFWVSSIVFPPPPSVFIGAMSAISFLSLASGGYSEVRGKHMQYSKFWDVNPLKKKKKIVSSRTGMLFLYTPAFLAAVSSLAIFPDEGLRFMLVDAALSIHFFKRVLEVLFIQKYSGRMVLDSVIPITLSYFVSTASLIYAQHLTQGIPEPAFDLKYVGVTLFLVGIVGNFYHHYILSRLRGKGEKGYKIPRGGMFNLVICPHYLFEILGFVGVSFISQTLYSFSFTMGTILYLIGRSYATRKWYLSKFDNFPKEVKCLIPFLF
ncbi:very-long-chain enoyl-CoA reductase-like isoform X1 [Macadamia integrifolia]|uniref:very-long-chain enoyl-CoA reductase-like isoform X1 n=1 Tax=Macadamia integrifolia TaxID=60698 RepID=UPI001C4E8EA9|nr:very-long-chain enoyl-CoA reductase-like isoform X1 [Macadamia integrifolia]